MKELTLTTKNQVGALATVAEALGGVGVNIEAISCYGVGERAIFRIITGDVTTALKTLSRLPGIEVRESDTIVVKLINRPGELGKITRKLANQGINIESLYIVSRKNDYTEVAFRPAKEDMEKARDLLEIKE